jgi:hypothetical protein
MNKNGEPMVQGRSRREILRGMAAALCMSPLAPFAIGESSTNPEATVRNRALTILYPTGPDTRFDGAYYRDHHMKLFMDIYGSAIERFELRLVESPASPFAAVINIWIADYPAFSARSTEAAYKQMGDDKPNFTNAHSTVEVDEVNAAVGDPRSRVQINEPCVSILYPNGTGTEWDVHAYGRKQLPIMMQRLGSTAVRRIEARKGLNLLDAGAPAYLGGVNIYIRDRNAFGVAWAKHGAELQAEAARLTKVAPVRVDTVVYGIEAAHRDG